MGTDETLNITDEIEKSKDKNTQIPYPLFLYLFFAIIRNLPHNGLPLEQSVRCFQIWYKRGVGDTASPEKTPFPDMEQVPIVRPCMFLYINKPRGS